MVFSDILVNQDYMQNLYIIINWFLVLFGVILFGVASYYNPERLVRPAFIVSLLMLVLYQLPMGYFADIFYKEKLDCWWFTLSINFSIYLGFLWVMYTPQLNQPEIYKEPSKVKNFVVFNKFELWVSVSLFFFVLFLYLYRVPFYCTALFSILFDTQFAVFIREVSIKLVGTNYATYALSIMATTISPIVAFLSIQMMYQSLLTRRFLSILFWFLMLIIVFIAPLLSGAKGNLIPTFITLSVAGFLCAYKWYSRIAVVIVINLLLIMILTILWVERASIGVAKIYQYQFGVCVTRLKICEETKTLLESLGYRDFALDLTKANISLFKKERQKVCNEQINTQKIFLQKNFKNALAEHKNALAEHKNALAEHKNALAEHKNALAEHKNVLTEHEKAIIEIHESYSLRDRINSIIHRAFVIPIEVAQWHFLYVKEHGKPGFFGLAIARKFTNNYIDMPSKICEIYETIRSGGDRTSTCSAPTGYLLTYPAYLGVWGLLVAGILTILFDLVGSLVIKYSAIPLNYLAIAFICVAGVNFMTADFSTVLVSHGAGAAFTLLGCFSIFRFITRR